MDNVSYPIRDIVAQAKAVEATGMKMHWFNVGDPGHFGFARLPWVEQAMAEAAGHRKNSYAPSTGLPMLREAIAARSAQDGRGGISPESIFVTAGLSEGLRMAISALAGPGDVALLPRPGYSIYKPYTLLAGAQPAYYSLDSSGQPDVGQVRHLLHTAHPKFVLVNSPGNPTGSVFTLESSTALMDAVAQYNAAHDAPVTVISDEIYHLLAFEHEHTPMAALNPDVPLIRGDGMSKNYFDPDQRIGWLEFHGPHLQAIQGALTRQCNIRLSLPHIPQQAAIAALTHAPDHLSEYKERLVERRDQMVSHLQGTPGLFFSIPASAFYFWAHVQGGPWHTDTEIVSDLMRSTGIVTVPGSAFVMRPTDKHLRLVFLPSPEEISESMDKFKGFMNERMG